jgi:hypothetical protein
LGLPTVGAGPDGEIPSVEQLGAYIKDHVGTQGDPDGKGPDLGVHWFDTEITKITDGNVMVRYAGEIALLDRRRLWYWWAFWRGCRSRLLQRHLQRRRHAAGRAEAALPHPVQRGRDAPGARRDEPAPSGRSMGSTWPVISRCCAGTNRLLRFLPPAAASGMI